jgi:hypothetical protein
MPRTIGRSSDRRLVTTPPLGKSGWRIVGTYAIFQWVGCAVVIVAVIVGIIIAIVKALTGQ